MSARGGCGGNNRLSRSSKIQWDYTTVMLCIVQFKTLDVDTYNSHRESHRRKPGETAA